MSGPRRQPKKHHLHENPDCEIDCAAKCWRSARENVSMQRHPDRDKRCRVPLKCAGRIKRKQREAVAVAA